MELKTTFDIGQTVFQAAVGREMETRTCPVCGGKGQLKTTAEDGSEHWVDCPMSKTMMTEDQQCRSGKVNVGMRHKAEPIRPLTVGKIHVEYGGLGPRGDRSFSNMGTHEDQSYECEESVMCYETGVGSGNVYDIEPRVGERGGRGVFATEDEAASWAEALVEKCDALLQPDPITDSRMDEAREEAEAASHEMAHSDDIEVKI